MSEVFLLNQGVLFIFNRTKLYEALEKKKNLNQTMASIIFSYNTNILLKTYTIYDSYIIENLHNL